MSAKWLENRGLSNRAEMTGYLDECLISVANAFEFVTVSIVTADQL